MVTSQPPAQSHTHLAAPCPSVAAAVGWARDEIVRVARGRPPPRDPGDAEPGGEDEEPPPCPPDPWARGSVPVSRPAQDSGGRRDPPAQPPSPDPGPSHLELLPGQPPPAPQPPDGDPPRARPPPAPLCPPGPPAPCPPPDPPRPLDKGRRPPQPPHRDPEGSGVAGGCTPPVTLPSQGAPRGAGAKPEGSVPVVRVPRRGSGSRPRRWVRPGVEVLDAEATPRPPAARWPLPGGPAAAGGPWLRPPSLGSLQPLAPRPLGRLLASAPLAPGVSVQQGGGREPGEEEEEEEEQETNEAKRELRPVRPAVPPPAFATPRLTGDGGR
ncbi:uncharacterized protein LOC142361473 [Opisthocomus hoazin]|uniref:uncharacterized protein LOC142361473 n=1 Tax=Opisthocomus hoazin TaxID=30419 RepID=UPI003F53C3FA